MHVDGKKTVVLGASPDPSRYSHLAVKRLLQAGIEVVPVGLRSGVIDGKEIQTTRTFIDGVDTISLYVGQKNFFSWFDFTLDLHPRRIILNPGAENSELEQKAKERGIEVMHACTLVMLSTKMF